MARIQVPMCLTNFAVMPDIHVPKDFAFARDATGHLQS